jgi:uncharacterized integral membrane protein
MRLFIIFVLVIFIAAGVIVGALNADLVGYDLGFAQVRLPKGAALLGVLVIGWLLGGLTAWLGVSSRRSRIRRHSQPAGKKPPVSP